MAHLLLLFYNYSLIHHTYILQDSQFFDLFSSMYNEYFAPTFLLFWFSFLVFPDTLFECTSYLHHMYTSEHNLLVLHFQQFGITCMLDTCFEPLNGYWQLLVLDCEMSKCLFGPSGGKSLPY